MENSSKNGGISDGLGPLGFGIAHRSLETTSLDLDILEPPPTIMPIGTVRVQVDWQWICWFHLVRSVLDAPNLEAKASHERQ